MANTTSRSAPCAAPPLKAKVKARLEFIQNLILEEKPFESELDRLYTDLLLGGKYLWLTQAYRLLLLSTPDALKHRLCHHALVQAFIKRGNAKQAAQTAQTILKGRPDDPETLKLLAGLKTRTESTLAPYTPLAAFTKYAAGKTPRCISGRREVPRAWKEAAALLSVQTLEELGYYRKLGQIKRCPAELRPLLLRDFNELTLNYLFKNYKTVVTLSGSVMEILLAGYLRKRLKLRKIALRGQRPRDVFDLNLNDLITYYTQHALLPEQILSLGRAARLLRNYVHPGKEVQEKDAAEILSLRAAGARPARKPPARDCLITAGSAQICFLSALELMDALL